MKTAKQITTTLLVTTFFSVATFLFSKTGDHQVYVAFSGTLALVTPLFAYFYSRLLRLIEHSFHDLSNKFDRLIDKELALNELITHLQRIVDLVNERKVDPSIMKVLYEAWEIVRVSFESLAENSNRQNKDIFPVNLRNILENVSSEAQLFVVGGRVCWGCALEDANAYWSLNKRKLSQGVQIRRVLVSDLDNGYSDQLSTFITKHSETMSEQTGSKFEGNLRTRKMDVNTRDSLESADPLWFGRDKGFMIISDRGTKKVFCSRISSEGLVGQQFEDPLTHAAFEQQFWEIWHAAKDL